MTSIAIKRIYKDLADITNSPLDNEGIWIHYDDSNIMDVYIVMIGPENTPYQNGFYLFKMTFPANYPFQPPAVKYCTLHENIRFNPNLYTCGKVCLSILNTWEGPKWTSCQTLRSVLMSIRALVLGVEYPLQNEPGYETETGNKAKQYNVVIEHENLNVAVLKMLRETPIGFEVFKQRMLKYVNDHYGWYHQRCNKLSGSDGIYAHALYGMRIKKCYGKIIKEILNTLRAAGYEPEIPVDEQVVVKTLTKHKLGPKIVDIHDMKLQSSEVVKGEKQPSVPSTAAKSLPVGTEMASDRDNGRMYVVIAVQRGQTQYHRWVPVTLLKKCKSNLLNL
jgi:ubiquitin-protein ligase